MAHEASKDTAHARRAGVTPPRQQAQSPARPVQVGGAPSGPAQQRSSSSDPADKLPAPKPLPLMHQFYLALRGERSLS